MNNPNKYIRKAIITALAPLQISIYDKVVPKSVNPVPTKYIILNSTTKVENNRTKVDKMYDVAMQADLVYTQPQGYIDSAVIDDLEQSFLQAIAPEDNVRQDLDLSADNLKVYNTFVDDNQDIDIETPTQTILRRVIRFRFTIGSL